MTPYSSFGAAEMPSQQANNKENGSMSLALNFDKENKILKVRKFGYNFINENVRSQLYPVTTCQIYQMDM
jgi:hypothetical protein